MKAIETTGKIDDRGRLFLDRPLALANYSHVRIIVLVPEDTDIDPDDDPTETVLVCVEAISIAECTLKINR